MNQSEIRQFIDSLQAASHRNIVIIDFGNVQKWENNLGWKIGVRELGNLTKHLTKGNKFLRRFYYGSDLGPNEKQQIPTMWSAAILNKARMSGFEIITKRVKYIHDKNYATGFVKKCDFDLEIMLDLIKEQKNYDTIFLFSGDGDMACVLEYLHNVYNKTIYIFGARNHTGREIFDARISGVIKDILFAEDFEYRLRFNRFNP